MFVFGSLGVADGGVQPRNGVISARSDKTWRPEHGGRAGLEDRFPGAKWRPCMCSSQPLQSACASKMSTLVIPIESF